jgi:hypothetical protein
MADLDEDDIPSDPVTQLYAQRVSVQLQRAQAQQLRALLSFRWRDRALTEDQEELERLHRDAVVEGWFTSDDAALVDIED